MGSYGESFTIIISNSLGIYLLCLNLINLQTLPGITLLDSLVHGPSNQDQSWKKNSVSVRRVPPDQ